jgi:hypothetical protein
VPFVGAWVAGVFGVLIALGTQGANAAIVMAVAAVLANGVLQQLVQPFVMGATLGLNPLVALVVTIGAGQHAARLAVGTPGAKVGVRRVVARDHFPRGQLGGVVGHRRVAHDVAVESHGSEP